ncbi:hypothetical protein GQ54DRAFT_114770 [Martensiomyces pterosporus]|nr:hypothetical protein GQ54DRAFT_114770 [Martensiomyces pterosporus]
MQKNPPPHLTVAAAVWSSPGPVVPASADTQTSIATLESEVISGSAGTRAWARSASPAVSRRFHAASRSSVSWNLPTRVAARQLPRTSI